MELSIANVYPSPGAGDGTGAGAGGGERVIDEDIKPYRIHVSSKYLDLTKKKLELTRLPHELLLPKEREWELGTPKSEVEPLVDFWLEHYNWRIRETHLNTTLPQFRTAISIPDSPHPLRIHFIHLRSSQPNAIPLLLIPSFPLTNLSLAPLFPALTSPPPGTQAFHLVVPSLPGLGFSDAFQTDEKLLEKSAGVCDVLMKRLGYEAYLASGTGSGRQSLGSMDYHLLRLLGERHLDSCLGVHLIDPSVSQPTLSSQPLNWLKFNIARFFHAEIFGYLKRDFLTLRSHARKLRGVGMLGLGLGLTQPNTLSYALCDSPVGLLSFVCAGLRRVNPTHSLSPLEMVDLAQLAWLPGPEAGMRFVSAAAKEVRDLERIEGDEGRLKTRVAVTVFDGNDADATEGHGGYTCPAWAGQRHEVVWSQRLEGKPGLVVWEEPDVILEGIRSLSGAVLKIDGRLGVSALEEVVVDIGAESEADDGAVVEVRELESVDGEWEDSIDEEQESVMQLDVESPATVVAVDLGR